jgi:hypothetical protein
VTTRTPLFDEAGWREDGADLGEMRSGLFLQHNLDDPNHVESADEIRICAQRVLLALDEQRVTVDRKCSLIFSVGQSVLPSAQAEPVACG